MRVSDATISKLQNLLKDFFDANAKSDNIAYWLGYNYYNNIEALYHQSWAHVFPSDTFADGLSNFMLKLGIRPVRLGIETHDKDYNSLADAMEDNKNLAEYLLGAMRDLVDIAEANDDVEVKLYGENLILTMVDYVKQAEEWDTVAKMTTPMDMNIHIKAYTNFIK